MFGATVGPVLEMWVWCVWVLDRKTGLVIVLWFKDVFALFYPAGLACLFVKHLGRGTVTEGTVHCWDEIVLTL